MIEFRMNGDKGILRTEGKTEEVLNELLSINLSVIKSVTESKEHFDNLKDQFVMLLVDDKITNAYYENSYDKEIGKEELEL